MPVEIPTCDNNKKSLQPLSSSYVTSNLPLWVPVLIINKGLDYPPHNAVVKIKRGNVSQNSQDGVPLMFISLLALGLSSFMYPGFITHFESYFFSWFCLTCLFSWPRILPLCPKNWELLLTASLLATGYVSILNPSSGSEMQLHLNYFLPGLFHTWTSPILSPFQPPELNRGYSQTSSSHWWGWGANQHAWGSCHHLPLHTKTITSLALDFSPHKWEDLLVVGWSCLFHWPWDKYLFVFLEPAEF